jgi:hypothetical protein
MMKTVTVLGVDLECDVDVTMPRAGAYYEPPEPLEVEINAIMLDGKDVIDLLSEWTLDKVQELLYESFSTYKEELAAEAAEMRREARRDEARFG